MNLITQTILYTAVLLLARALAADLYRVVSLWLLMRRAKNFRHRTLARLRIAGR